LAFIFYLFDIIMRVATLRFLQGVSIAFYAEPCISYGQDISLSVCPFVCHALESSMARIHVNIISLRIGQLYRIFIRSLTETTFHRIFLIFVSERIDDLSLRVIKCKLYGTRV